MNPSPRHALDAPPARVGFGEAARVWLKIGWLSFGGPAGQIALMHRELVERRRWISESRFLHALNYCMLLPGPEAQQLATYIGWLLHRTPGGIVAGGLFVLPGFLTMLLVSALYVAVGQLPAFAALFVGLKAAVLAIVIEAVIRIGRRVMKRGLMLGLSVAAFVAIFAFDVGFPWIIAGAALIGALGIRGPGSEPSERERAPAHAHTSLRGSLLIASACLVLWVVPVALVVAWLGADHVIAREGFFFSQTALITFGGAYAVLAYVAQRAVEQLHWLSPGQMLDGLALAETTPGPLILVLQFVGFVAAYHHAAPLGAWTAAVIGAAITTWVTFVPSFLFVLVGAPYMEALRGLRALDGALAGITAAVVGVILNLSVWFALHTMFGTVETIRFAAMRLEVPDWTTIDPVAAAITLAALIAMLRFRLPMGWTLLACASAGAAFEAFR
jgi:chromate transporter